MGMLTMLTVSMMAVPANRKSVKVTQPDGSTVTIQLQGDEWQHFNTTTDGYSVTMFRSARPTSWFSCRT